MLGAGQATRNRVRFERREVIPDDGYGNESENWATALECSAAFRPKFGREQLEAGRLESTMQGTLTVRRTPATAAVAADSRVLFTAGPYKDKACQIRSIIPTPDNREIEFLIEEGVAT